MQSFEAAPAAFHFADRVCPMLKGMVDEVCGTLARLIAYLCTLALLFMAGVYLWDRLPDMRAAASIRPEWTSATRSIPAFAVNHYDFSYKTRSYEILRHPEGGRKDVMRWVAEDGQPIAEFEIYRGEEPGPAAALDGVGAIDSKFGSVALIRRPGDGCLGFLRTMEQPALRISGFVCRGETVPARAAAVACLLNRLGLVTAGNDAKLAELFARAELKRADCRTDWVSGSDKPALRGAI